MEKKSLYLIRYKFDIEYECCCMLSKPMERDYLLFILNGIIERYHKTKIKDVQYVYEVDEEKYMEFKRSRIYFSDLIEGLKNIVRFDPLTHSWIIEKKSTPNVNYLNTFKNKKMVIYLIGDELKQVLSNQVEREKIENFFSNQYIIFNPSLLLFTNKKDNQIDRDELFSVLDIYKDNGRFPLDTEIILLFDDTVPVFPCLKDILSRVSNEYTIHCYLRHMQSFYLCENHFNDVLFKYI